MKTSSWAMFPSRIVTFAWARFRASARIVVARTPRAMSSATAAASSAHTVRSVYSRTVSRTRPGSTGTGPDYGPLLTIEHPFG